MIEWITFVTLLYVTNVINYQNLKYNGCAIIEKYQISYELRKRVMNIILKKKHDLIKVNEKEERERKKQK